MGKAVGVIYILTNPSFPEYVKLGYADDIEQRLRQLNRSECVPFAFRVYALYEVEHRLADLNLHKLIDRLNPNIRAVENFNGKTRTREFYAMSPDDAYSILEAIALMHGRSDRLVRVQDDVMAKMMQPQRSESMSLGDKLRSFESEYGVRRNQVQSAPSAENLGKVGNPKQKRGQEQKKERAKPFAFSLVGIPVGAIIEYCRDGDAHSGEVCRVVDDKHVWYNEQAFSLTSLAQYFAGNKQPVQGTLYFKYNGEWLNDMRSRLGV